MAIIKTEPGKKRWCITPDNIIERSALLKLPARKWMTVLNMFFVPMTRMNARVLKEALNSGELREQPRLNAPCDEPTFIASVDALLAPARSDRTFPTWYKFNNLKHPPMEHQIDALRRLYPVHAAALFMEMGTAKTRVMIDLMTAHFYERRIQFVIVITPVTVKLSTWQDELANFSPCPYNFIDVDSDYRASSLRLSQDRLTWLVVGVESLSQGKTYNALEPVTRMGAPYACGVDESTRVANWKAICTQAAFDLRRNAALRFIATGFEVKKSIEDLYSQFEFLDPNIIGCGDWYAFRNRYCMMGGYKNKEIIGYDHVDELMGLIAPYVYQCDKSILKLPPKLYEKRLVKMTPEQTAAYRAIKKGLVDRVSIENTLTRELRLQQVTAGFYNTDRWEKDPVTGKKVEVQSELVEVVPPSKNPKLRELLAIAKEVSHPMIVWAETQYELNIIQQALQKLGEVIRFDGSVPREERRAIIHRFQMGVVPYFVGTTAAGGIGITLTAARTVVYFSNNQRLEHRIQSEDRAHRKGQTGSVTIVDLVAQGTVNASLLTLHSEKIDLAIYVKHALRDKIAMEKYTNGEIDAGVMDAARREMGVGFRQALGAHEAEPA